jgi:hypothetical protein
LARPIRIWITPLLWARSGLATITITPKNIGRDQTQYKSVMDWANVNMPYIVSVQVIATQKWWSIGTGNIWRSLAMWISQLWFCLGSNPLFDIGFIANTVIYMMPAGMFG